MKKAIIIKIGIVAWLLSWQILYAQELLLADSALARALSNHPAMKYSRLNVEQQRLLKKGAYTVNNLEILFESPTANGFRPGILQTIDFPTVYVNQVKAQESRVRLAESETEISRNQLTYQVLTTYLSVQYAAMKSQTYARYDSVFSEILKINDLRYGVGQISSLEKVNSEARYRLINNQLRQIITETRGSKMQLAILMGRAADTAFTTSSFERLPEPIGRVLANQNPLNQYFAAQERYSERLLRVEKSKLLPGLTIGFLNQGSGDTPPLYQFRFGVTIPLWFWTNRSRIKAARKGIEIASAQSKLNEIKLLTEQSRALTQVQQYRESLEYFEKTGREQAAAILRDAGTAYRLGSISYYAYIQNLEQVFQLELGYLEALKNYNQAVLQVQYILGNFNR